MLNRCCLRVLREQGRWVRQFAAFSGIGVVNTVVHFAMVLALVELFYVQPVLANAAAFVAANLFSYWANSRWIFLAAATPGRYLRFFIVSVAGLLLTVALASLAAALGWHYLLGTALVVAVLPLLTFAAHRLWTWPTAP